MGGAGVQPGAAVLVARGVSKHFGGIQALDQVDLTLYGGEVHALVGENGAGKSTLMKILAGVHTQFEGGLRLAGQPLVLTSPREALARGIAMIHQELNLIPYLSVAENIFLGREFRRRGGWLDRARLRRAAAELLRPLDPSVDPDVPVCRLRVGQQQVVEIAKALSLQARVVIMDEPTSALSDREATSLFAQIRTLRRQGVAVVYISHKLDEILALSDRVTVLRDGRVVHTCPATGLTSEALVSLMVGRALTPTVSRSVPVSAEPVLRVEELCLTHPTRPGDFLVDHVSLEVFGGEVLGLFGLMGAGRSELLEAIFGLHPGRTTGRLWVGERSLRCRSARNAIDAGMALVPEDRKRQGLVPGMSLRQNITLACLDRVTAYGFFRPGREQSLTATYVERLGIKTAGDRQAVRSLSGGNQQKVVLGKWLATCPRVLMLDEPTRGIDVRAKAEIYRQIRDLAQGGMAILMVSSELPEILALSDRVAVLSEGCLTACLPRAQATEPGLLRAALPAGRVPEGRCS